MYDTWQEACSDLIPPRYSYSPQYQLIPVRYDSRGLAYLPCWLYNRSTAALSGTYSLYINNDDWAYNPTLYFCNYLNGDYFISTGRLINSFWRFNNFTQVNSSQTFCNYASANRIAIFTNWTQSNFQYTGQYYVVPTISNIQNYSIYRIIDDYSQNLPFYRVEWKISSLFICVAIFFLIFRLIFRRLHR